METASRNFFKITNSLYPVLMSQVGGAGSKAWADVPNRAGGSVGYGSVGYAENNYHDVISVDKGLTFYVDSQKTTGKSYNTVVKFKKTFDNARSDTDQAFDTDVKKFQEGMSTYDADFRALTGTFWPGIGFTLSTERITSNPNDPRSDLLVYLQTTLYKLTSQYPSAGNTIINWSDAVAAVNKDTGKIITVFASRVSHSTYYKTVIIGNLVALVTYASISTQIVKKQTPTWTYWNAEAAYSIKIDYRPTSVLADMTGIPTSTVIMGNITEIIGPPQTGIGN